MYSSFQQKIGVQTFNKQKNDSHIYKIDIFDPRSKDFSWFLLGVLVTPKINNVGVGAWWRVQETKKPLHVEFRAFKIMQSGFYCANLKQIGTMEAFKSII